MNNVTFVAKTLVPVLFVSQQISRNNDYKENID